LEFKMKKLYFIAYLLVITWALAACGSSSTSSTGGETGDGVATLSWMPPTQNTDDSQLTDLTGYKIYYGTASDQLITKIDVDAGITEYRIDNLPTGKTYYFAMTATNSLQIESALSKIVSKNL
jgi:hypothetical protein